MGREEFSAREDSSLEDELDSDEKVNDEKCELAIVDCELVGLDGSVLDSARLESTLLGAGADELGVGVGLVPPLPPPPHAVSTSKKLVQINTFNEKASFLLVKKNSMSSPK
jgi:hypothetical protein